MGEPKRFPLPKICHIYPTKMKLGTFIPYLKKIHKIYKSREWITYINHLYESHSLSSANISIFLLEISKFCYIRKYRYRSICRYIFWYIISNSFNFFWILKDFFNKHGYNFDDVRKMATLGLLKIKVFWNKGYDVIISVYDVINKNFTLKSNYMVDVFMWPKFGNSSTSVREVIITSILQGFDQEKHFFEGWSWLKFNNLRLTLGMALKFYTIVIKGL